MKYKKITKFIQIESSYSEYFTLYFPDSSKDDTPPKYKLRLDLEKSSPSKDIILTPTLDPDIGKGLTIDQAKKKLNHFLRYGEYLLTSYHNT